MAPRQLFKTLQQVAQEGLNQRLRQAAVDGKLNISISSTMNLSVGRMQEVVSSPGPDVSIVEIKQDDDGNMSLTALLEEVMDDHTSTPPCDITGHIMEVEIGKVESTSQPAVCSTFPAVPLRTSQPAVCPTVPQQAVFAVVSEQAVSSTPVQVNPFVSSYGQASTDEWKNYARMSVAVDPYPTAGHSPDKHEFKAALNQINMQVVNLQEENRSLVDKSTFSKQHEQQVVQSLASEMEIQRNEFTAEIQRLRNLHDAQVLQNQQLHQSNSQLEQKKE